jgi:hypothetical protein
VQEGQVRLKAREIFLVSVFYAPASASQGRERFFVFCFCLAAEATISHLFNQDIVLLILN